MASRGSSIALEPEWLDYLHSLWRQVKTGDHPAAGGEPRTLEWFGRQLAKTIKRRDPFSAATVSRYLAGKVQTDELTQAFSEFFVVPYPILAARSVAEVEWFELGRYLRVHEPENFALLIENARRRVRAARELA